MRPTPEHRNRLKQFSIFQSVRDQENCLDEILKRLRVLEFKAGQEILRDGETGDTAFLLVRGTVEILKHTIDGSPYTVTLLRDQNSPIFGEISLVGQDRRTATVRAVDACECWVITRKDFVALGDEDPKLGWQLLQPIASVLAERLQSANRDMMTLFEALVCEIGHLQPKK